MKISIQLFCLFITISNASAGNNKPELSLAGIYRPEININNYWVSEKLDGVRAYWNGNELISRQGNVFDAPDWFTRVLPEVTLDGELWIGRNHFDELSGKVRTLRKNKADWRNIKYMVFDLPGSTRNFNQRLKKLKQLVNKTNATHIQLIKQFKVTSHQALTKVLDETVSAGGEGLMLHLGTSLYQKSRNTNVLKLKKYSDAEAIVIKHLPGKGKYKGMLGSLLVETTDKKRFKVGTGFTDQQRKNPPSIGSTVTYKYYGKTKKGIPRFASFMRIRNND